MVDIIKEGEMTSGIDKLLLHGWSEREGVVW